MSAPCVADDIKVNKCPREDYPTHRGGSTRRYRFYGEPASSSTEDDGAYASSAVMTSTLDRSDIQGFAVKGVGGTSKSRTRTATDRSSQKDRKARAWRKRFKEGMVKHLRGRRIDRMSRA